MKTKVTILNQFLFLENVQCTNYNIRVTDDPEAIQNVAIPVNRINAIINKSDYVHIDTEHEDYYIVSEENDIFDKITQAFIEYEL